LEAVIVKQGNSSPLRIPAEIIRRLGLDVQDTGPQKGSLEYLFKDYSGKTFRTELINPQEPVGNERW
jgi:hypothetical protein